MTLQDIITGIEMVLEHGQHFNTQEKTQMKITLTLAKEIQELKDYVRQNEEDL